MSDFEIRIVGAKPPRKPAGLFVRAVRGLFRLPAALARRPRLVVLFGLAGFVVLVGTPHVGGDYQCSHPMRGPGSCRSVAWCAYYGIQGRRIEVPAYGQSCKLMTVLPVKWERLWESL